MTHLRRLILLFLVWGAAAAAAGHAHALAHLPLPIPPILIGALSGLLAISALRVGWVRGAFEELGTRRILALHGFRFIGFAFLWYHALGLLPAEFAERAGWGDVATAAGALLLLLLDEGSAFGFLLPVWNVFGLADLAMAVGTAGWLSATRPGSMQAIGGLPLALVPLWLVPFLVASHVALLNRRRPSVGTRRAPA